MPLWTATIAESETRPAWSRWGERPISPDRFGAYCVVMEINRKTVAVTRDKYHDQSSGRS
jgi:hypothetical protein